MTLDLFPLLPAVYRTRDIELAQSQALLTPAETTELNALKALVPPLSIDQQLRLAELTAKIDARTAAIAPAADPGAAGGHGRGSRAALRRSVHRDLRAVGHSLHRRPHRLSVGEGDRAGDRQPAIRRRGNHLAAAPQGHRPRDGGTRARRHRMGRARRRVLPGARRYAVHEPPAPVEPLRAGSAALAGRVVHRDRLRSHGAQGRCAADRGAPRPLQHPEHRHLPVVAERLPRHEAAGRDQRRGRPLPALKLSGHGHPAVPPGDFPGRRNHRTRAAVQRRRSRSSAACSATTFRRVLAPCTTEKPRAW